MRGISRSIALLTLAITFVLLVSVPTSRGEFSKQVNISGGSPAPRLSAALVTAGYTGGTSLDELTLRNLDSNANTFYIGSKPTVTTDGFPLAPGDSYTWRSGGRAIEADSIYLYTSTVQSVAVTLRER